MAQEILDLHCGSVPHHGLPFFWRVVFVDICNRGLTDFAELLIVCPNDGDRPSIYEAFKLGCRILQ